MWLKIEADSSNSQYKISWGNGGGFYSDSYSVGMETLQQAADALRAELDRLSEWAQTGDPTQRRARLVELAKAGRDLRYCLFNDRTKREAIKELEQWIADGYGGGDRELTIQAPSSVHVPWGLVYDGDPDAVSATSANAGNARGTDAETAKQEIEQFRGFWSLKYSPLSATPSGEWRSKARMTRSRKTFGLLSLINKDVQDQIARDLKEEDARRFSELLTRPPVGVANKLKECEELIGKTEQVDILFHFLGHHRENTLDLGSGEKIGYVEFSRLLDMLVDREYERGTSPCGLLFLNGCESAVGEKDFTLRAESGRRELCGVIATEALVRRKYANLFGFRFLEAMVNEGKTVAQTMEELHRDADLWPESLLYGCYANPAFKIEQAVTV